MEYLVVLEISRKQNYIFRTNRLLENIGASIIIRDITEEIAKEFLVQKTSDTSSDISRVDENTRPVYDGEYWFAGGGKSIYVFKDEDNAKGFIGAVSRKVLREYPGVELFMVKHGYDETGTSIIDAVKELDNKLEKKKSERQNAFRLYGLGITERCVSTQMPAVKKDPYEGLQSKETQKKYMEANLKRNGITGQDRVFRELLPDTEKYLFANKFEELGGTKTVKDYLAVVVLDGNKMGKRIEMFREQFREDHNDLIFDDGKGRKDYKSFNTSYKEAFRKYSESIDKVWRRSMKQMVERLAAIRDVLVGKGIIEPHETKDGKKVILPMRPLIMAGDDICFVCDSRISLNLAEIILEEVEKQDPPTMGDKEMPRFHAAVGIAIVKNHYPFFRAHKLAEELCSNAKSMLDNDIKEDESVIDFLIVQGEIVGSLGEIRKEKYKERKDSAWRLTSKPYYYKGKKISAHAEMHGDDTDSGAQFDTKRQYEDEYQDIRKNSLPYFKEQMKKVKSLSNGFVKGYMEALADGPKAADQYLAHKRKNDVFKDSFWICDEKDDKGERLPVKKCVDFEVIEMMDIYTDWT